MILKVNHKSVPHSCQCPVGGIEESVRSEVVTWLKPFSLEYSLKNLGEIKLWRI